MERQSSRLKLILKDKLREMGGLSSHFRFVLNRINLSSKRSEERNGMGTATN